MSRKSELRNIREAQADRDFAIECKLRDWLDTPAAEQNPRVRREVRDALKDGSFRVMWNALRMTDGAECKETRP